MSRELGDLRSPRRFSETTVKRRRKGELCWKVLDGGVPCRDGHPTPPPGRRTPVIAGELHAAAGLIPPLVSIDQVKSRRLK
jgi:hypothetical protein